MASTEAGSTSQSQHDTESASSVALSNRDDTSSQRSMDDEDNGEKRINQKWLLNYFSKDWKHYYRTFELNEKLYLHFKGKSNNSINLNEAHEKFLEFGLTNFVSFA